ncbi:hypothetical protein BH09ACT8_BH09ACT8_07480 [soil metagenome]
MEIVLGVSMTPTTVRMVLVEGEKADGVTVDHDSFDISADDASATAPEQVMAAILGTRESAVEGGHRLVSTGVTWRDHAEAAALRDALAARNIDDVMLVSELHAAAALAQAVGATVGYDRTALLFLERDTATLSVVETADGAVVKVQRHDLHTDDAVGQLTAMVADLADLPAPPQGVFVLGSGIPVAAIKLHLESATSLPVSAPDEAELALARGAALASANAPLFEASTVGLAYAKDSGDGTTAGAYAAGAGLAAADVTQAAGADYMVGSPALAYSAVDPDSGVFPQLDAADEFVRETPDPVRQEGRKPFLLVGSALTSIFVLGVTALVISLAVSIRPTVDQRPSPGESVIVPTEAPAAPAPAPQAAVPAVPAPPPETIKAPIPVVQQAPEPQAPRTVYVQRPAAKPVVPEAPAPAPAPVAPAPAPEPVAPPVVAPPPVAEPYVPPVYIPPILQLPRIFSPPRQQQQYPQYPQQQYPQQQYPQYPQQQQPEQQQPQQQWPGQGSGRGGDGGRASDGSGHGGGNNGILWPLPIFGGH